MSDRPKRIQRKRAKGWRMPPNTVSVTRPGKWGNPFRVGVVSEFGDVPDAETAVAFYRSLMDKGLQRINIIRELRGKNLACFCHICDSSGRYVQCHADVLLAIANDMTPEEVRRENLRWAERQEM